MDKLKVQSDVKPFTMVKNSIIDSEEILNEHEKILYVVLLRYGDKAFPSLTTLSKKCGFSKKTAQRTINTLIEKGLLKKKNRMSKKNGNTSNIYTLLDNDKIWRSSKENLKENLEMAILDEAVKIVEAAGLKVLDKEKELVCEPTKAHTQATKLNQANINNNNITIPKSQDLERYTLDQIKQLFDYNIMIQDNPCLQQDLDSVMDVLYTAMNTTKATIRISREDKPAMVVISKLMKLHKESIIYAIEKFREQTERIKNPASYMLTTLYNAPEQFYLDIQNQVSHDMTYGN